MSLTDDHVYSSPDDLSAPAQPGSSWLRSWAAPVNLVLLAATITLVWVSEHAVLTLAGLVVLVWGTAACCVAYHAGRAWRGDLKIRTVGLIYGAVTLLLLLVLSRLC